MLDMSLPRHVHVKCIALMVFRRKDLCKARPKLQSVLTFSDVLFALSQMNTPGLGFGSGWHFVRLWVRLTFGQMYSLDRDISWPSVILLWVSLTFGQIFGSCWPLVRHTSHPGRDILWPSVILLWVSLIFGQIFGSGWPLVRCIPWAETSHG